MYASSAVANQTFAQFILGLVISVLVQICDNISGFYIQITKMLKTRQTLGPIEYLYEVLNWSSHHYNRCFYQPMHYWLRPIKRGQFRFANFALHLKGKCHVHFLIH